MTQRREQGGGAWDGSFLTGPVPPPLRFHLASPHLRFFLRHLPLLQNSLPGKENRNQEGGVLGEKGAMGIGGQCGPKPPPPRNPHSRKWDPPTNQIHYCLYCSGSSWGAGSPLPPQSCASIWITPEGELPPAGEPLSACPLLPKTSVHNWNEGSGTHEPGSVPTLAGSSVCPTCMLPLLGMGAPTPPNLVLCQPGHWSLSKRTPWHLRPGVWRVPPPPPRHQGALGWRLGAP